MIKRQLMYIVLSIFLMTANVSADNHIWSHSFGDADDDLGVDVAVDGEGNVFITGAFIGSVDFGGGVLASAGYRDIFLAKYDMNGNHIWSQRFGDIDEDWGDGIAIDRSGNVLIAGAFNGAIDFGGGMLTSVGGRDLFLAKYDANGNHIWSLSRGSLNSDGCHDVAVDGENNVFATGWYDSGMDGSDLIGLAKFDSLGSEVWYKFFTDPSEDTGRSVATDNANNVIVTGYFKNSADFGGGPLTSAGDGDVFLAKYDPAGNHIWSSRFGGAGFDGGEGIAIDGANNVLLTGFFSDTADLGGDSLISAGSSDIFIAKYDAAGNHIWSKSFGDGYTDAGHGIAADTTNNMIITGIFRNSVDFGGGSLISAGSSDIFVAKYDASGNHLWSLAFGDVDEDKGYGIAADTDKNLLVIGCFQYSVDFGGGALISAGSADIFLAKLGSTITGFADTPPRKGLDSYAYPNPFNPGTTIVLTLPEDSHVILRIYDISGRVVTTLYDGRMSLGLNKVTWDGKNCRGDDAGSGIYFYRLVAGDFVQTRKMVLLR